jgi:hypothetical protein
MLGLGESSSRELYGSRDEARGAKDEGWLPKVGKRGWAALTNYGG